MGIGIGFADCSDGNGQSELVTWDWHGGML